MTLAAGFFGSLQKLLDLDVADKYVWAQAFAGLQTSINGEIRNMFLGGRFTVLKELEAFDTSVKKLHPMIQDGVDPVEADAFQNSVLDLAMRGEKLPQGLLNKPPKLEAQQGLDLLTKEVDSFFLIVLTGRDALLSNLRLTGTDSNTKLGGNVLERVLSR
ncbi:protein BPS1, chloroplastic-like [Carya illinoinensis]|uniref:protein BPS1, chloroplastic-like n=1 Tax=Carya illinoinensis TaxID=32201 RepID=UPI001C719C4B|nr:protein BPS1, chloroplastic-like [Carya illinoinensis]